MDGQEGFESDRSEGGGRQSDEEGGLKRQGEVERGRERERARGGSAWERGAVVITCLGSRAD
eukprot:646235-Rhodomonas_salina.1